MRACLVLAVLLASAGVARGDVFAFKDLEGFEKCMQLDHLIERVDTRGGSQARVLGPPEIQARCIASAVKLVAATKNKELAFGLVKATKRLSAPENAIGLTAALAELSIAACNELAIYEVFIKALSYPKDDALYLPRARGVVRRCLKDQQFRKDFLEEQESGDPNVAANACQILLEDKLVKSCKAAK